MHKLQFHRGLDILEKINHADGFSSTFLTQGDSGAKQKALSRTALLWFFWQFVEFGACHWLIIVSRCRDWIVEMFKILHVWGQDEKRVMAIGREYRNVRMLSKMPFDDNGFVSKQIWSEKAPQIHRQRAPVFGPRCLQALQGYKS